MKIMTYVASFLTGIAMLAIAFLLFGCGGSPALLVRAGSGPAELAHDQYECELLVRQSPYAQAYARDPLGNMGYPMMARQEMLECLTKYKGWREVSRDEVEVLRAAERAELDALVQRAKRASQLSEHDTEEVQP